MNTISVPPQYTPEDLLTMPDEPRYELINGQLVERNMGALASRIAARLIGLIDPFAELHRLGYMFSPTCGYQIFPSESKRVRYPDGSFVAAGRFPGEQIPQGHIRIPPDLAFEVVSPNDLAEEVEAKVEDYLQAGIKLIWLVYANTRSVYVIRRGGSVTRLTCADELSGEDVIPGFVCHVEQLFPAV
jgi:Uma2 family endonuclease